MIKDIKIFSAVIILLAAAGLVSAQEPYAVRIDQIVKELNAANKSAAVLNNELSALASHCDCKNARSQCRQQNIFSVEPAFPPALGEPCPERNTMEKKQMEMRNKADQITFLEKLLKAEMGSGLQAQMKTMEPEKGKELKEYLNDILGSSERIKIPILENIRIASSNDYSASSRCNARCNEGFPTKFSACAVMATGEQKPITMNINVKAGLDDLNLGDIKIDEIKLNLPEELNLADLISFSGSDIILPRTSQKIPSVKIKDLDNINMDSTIMRPNTVHFLDSFSIGLADLACQQMQNTTNYQCQTNNAQSQQYGGLQWYLQTFSWLSEKCQAIPAMKDDLGVPIKEKMDKCFDRANVHLTILGECDDLLNKYTQCFIGHPFDFATKCAKPLEICDLLSASKKEETIRIECQNLYTQRSESVPIECRSGTALATLQNKCDLIKKSEEKEMPEPCKFLPLFTKKIEQPEPTILKSGSATCPEQRSSSSQTGIKNSCFALDYPLNPRFKLPDLIIPDIDMGGFSFMPFLKVKLPKFIFEDLIFSDMKICNLSACSNLLNAKINIPSLDFKIPDIKVPAVDVGVPGAPAIRKSNLEIGEIEFPSIYFRLPDLDLSKLIDLNMLFPQTSMPTPKITVSLEGIDVDVMNLLLGLVASLFNIQSGCVGLGANIPVVISFPDYYFYWPKFPQVPKTPSICEKADSFCQKTQGSLNQITDKINKIQEVINDSIQVSQDKIQNAASAIEKKIKERAMQELEKAKAELEKALGDSFKDAITEAKRLGRDYIDPKPASISERRIPLPMDEIQKELDKIPAKIPINWPEELKTIKLPQPIIIPMSSIPLSGLSYNKKIELRIPGFQKTSMSVNLDFLGNYAEFSSSSASGGNPFPMITINSNNSQTNNISNEINNFSNKASELLNF